MNFIFRYYAKITKLNYSQVSRPCAFRVKTCQKRSEAATATANNTAVEAACAASAPPWSLPHGHRLSSSSREDGDR